MQLNTLLTNAKLTMALNQSPFHHTVSLFTKMKGKLGHRVRDPPAVKQIIKWQFALKQFAISSLFFCTLLTLHKQERDTNLQRGEVLQVRLQSWWFVCVPWCKASSKLRLVDAVPACCLYQIQRCESLSFGRVFTLLLEHWLAWMPVMYIACCVWERHVNL